MTELDFVREQRALREAIDNLARGMRETGLRNANLSASDGAPRTRLAIRAFTCGVINVAQALQVLPADEKRAYLLIQNNSTANLFVGLDSAPQSAGQCMVLGPGNFWEPQVCPTNSIYVISATLTNARGIAIFGTL